ncbi:unnamed protein product [Rhizophagus irregularis]|nr:unnamed protein product [Rhizophagus irregularis]CAB4422103.1 unnamed protein product [Rhizophagus irregularis]
MIFFTTFSTSKKSSEHDISLSFWVFGRVVIRKTLKTAQPPLKMFFKNISFFFVGFTLWRSEYSYVKGSASDWMLCQHG